MKDNAGWREVGIATAVAAVACWLACREMGLLALGLTVMSAWLIAGFALRRLGGLTGDIYGALCELVETLVLLIFAARAEA
jgi:adenosylcobinamide-GDP ribazoletransferase